MELLTKKDRKLKEKKISQIKYRTAFDRPMWTDKKSKWTTKSFCKNRRDRCCHACTISTTADNVDLRCNQYCSPYSEINLTGN